MIKYSYMDPRHNHVAHLLSGIALKNYPHEFIFHTSQCGDLILLNFASKRQDNVSGSVDKEWQHGRVFVIAKGDSDKSILRTALLALLTFEEHELREQFTYKGQALYEPDHS